MQSRWLARYKHLVSPKHPSSPQTPPSDVDKQRFKARGFSFAPLRGWLGGEMRERVEGWACVGELRSEGEGGCGPHWEGAAHRI